MKKKKRAKKVAPQSADERRFWSMLEAAWETQPDAANVQRERLVTRDLDEDAPDTKAVNRAMEKVVAALRKELSKMTSAELTAIDTVIERKLYDIDRSEIQEVTDGSDDGFLYARGWILAMGEAFYDAVDNDPRVAIMDEECEEMCYLAAHVHEKKFGDWPKTKSKISRESCSNPDGWDN
jgi:hypothetical protein